METGTRKYVAIQEKQKSESNNMKVILIGNNGKNQEE